MRPYLLQSTKGKTILRIVLNGFKTRLKGVVLSPQSIKVKTESNFAYYTNARKLVGFVTIYVNL